LESGIDISVVNKWDLEDIQKAGEMLQMKSDYEDAYTAWSEAEAKKDK
jgi:hypothetical protein